MFFSRYFSSPDWRKVQLRPKGVLRALAVIASPTNLARYGLAPIDATRELARANVGLAPIPVTALHSGSASLARLSDALGQGYDIVYLVAHGALRDGEPHLWLEDDSGSVRITPASELVTRFRELQQCPRLVLLISCQSAGSGDEDAVVALGPRLAGAGVPAVLAMQGNVSVETVDRFLPAFFTQLLRNGQVDQAVATARAAVRERTDAWMPVLFTRLKSGRLWYTPGFADEQQGFSKWPSLIDSINSGNCTPILGAGLLDPLLGSTREIASQWSELYALPLDLQEREDLPQVTQFLAVNQNPQFPRDKLSQYLRNEILRRFGEQLPPELRCVQPAPRTRSREAQANRLDALIAAAGAFQRAADEAEPHRVLASLPFPVYITTNPDNLLEAALRAVDKEPREVICPWNDYVERSQLADYDDEPEVQCPLVYHLFGRLHETESLVLTEDDYFDFLVGVTKHNDLIPDAVRSSLADTALLFLGFRMDDWNFRVLFRSLMNREGQARKRRYAHVAVQINPEEGRTIEPESARQFLESYCQGAEISIFWGTVEEFLRELLTRLKNSA